MLRCPLKRFLFFWSNTNYCHHAAVEASFSDPDTFGTLAESTANKNKFKLNNKFEVNFKEHYTKSNYSALEKNIQNEKFNFSESSLVSQKKKLEFPLKFEEYEETAVEFSPNRLTAHSYGRKMLELCQQKKLSEALKVFEKEMKEVGCSPDSYCYNILINACGKAGYTKKAFELYKKMKESGIQPEKFAYTGLFNACANSPWSEDGLKRCTILRKELADKEILLSNITYHAMIKAFGRTGNLKVAFEIVDEMLLKGHNITIDTISFLLQGCVSDKDAGFRHALLVWKRLRKLRLKPTIYSYNTLLRAMKECKAGDANLTFELLGVSYNSDGCLEKKNKSESNEDINNYSMQNNFFSEKELGSLEVRNVEVISAPAEDSQTKTKNAGVLHDENELPNMLSNSVSKDVHNLTSLSNSEDRLLLLGGIDGILRNMKRDKVEPNLATFSYILDSLPPHIEFEKELLNILKKYKVEPDVIFCNKLIQRRSKFHKLEDAKDVLDIMQEYHILPDVVTFGCLALGCRNPEDILSLLKDIEMAKCRPNREIMETLIKNALYNRCPLLAVSLLNKMNNFDLLPSPFLIEKLECERQKIKKFLVQVERNERTCSKRTFEGKRQYLIRYSSWLKKGKVRISDHPWRQYDYEDEEEQPPS